MHNCEEFRERITEYIIDREDVSKKTELQRELLMCSSCSDFYAQSREMMDALSEIDLTISENQWNGIEHRLCATILNEGVGYSAPSIYQNNNVVLEFERNRKPRIYTPVLATAAALLLITVGLSRLAIRTPSAPDAAGPQEQAVYIEHAVPLDPVTIDFLQESELLLRNVMKITPNDVQDLADAKKVASEQLAELEQRKQAAADVPPVVGVMETYETVLRDLRNVDTRTVDEDIGDIQRRIQKNGLIANMKAFQPRVTEVSFR
jgi:hypothetical protein